MRKDIFILFVLLALSSSCEEFLNIDPVDEISLTQALEDFESLDIAMIGAYKTLTEIPLYREHLLLYADAAGGNIKPNFSAGGQLLERIIPIYSFSLAAEDDFSGHDLYRFSYLLINQVNNILEFLPLLPDGDPLAKQFIEGEALFLRALGHYNLCRIYGQPYSFTPDASHLGIPVIEKRTSPLDLPSRNTVKEVYESMTRDLLAAAERMDGQNKRNGPKHIFANRYAALALLVRISLDQELWEEADAFATQIIDEGGFQLIEGNNFITGWASRNGMAQESIFEVDFREITVANISRFVGSGFNTTLGGSISNDLAQLFDLDDKRGPGGLIDTTQNLLTTRKYPFISGTETNIRVFRLAEVLLNRAEARAQSGALEGSRTDLMTVRSRALADPPLPDLNQGILLEEILLEKRKEFYMEGQWFFELTRRGMDVVREDCDGFNCIMIYPNERFVLPIPFRQVVSNQNIIQNPGY